MSVAGESSPALQLLGRIALEMNQMRPLLPTYLHLLVSAIFPIYTAAHASLARPPSAAKPEKRTTKDEDGEPSEDEDDNASGVPIVESLTAWDALTFPLLAGVTLSSLYFLIKWLEDPAILNKILSVYFSQMGIFFGTNFLIDMGSILRSVLLPKQYSLGGAIWHVDAAKSCFASTSSTDVFSHPSPLPGALRNLPLPHAISSAIWRMRRVTYTKAHFRLNIYKLIKAHGTVDLLDVVSFATVMGIVTWQTFISTPWYLTNFMGFSFCYGSLQMVTPTTGWIGSLVLGALFFYDIYFVFWTPMMVAVATKLEVPIKLLFPRPSGCVMPVGAVEGSLAMQEYLECLAKKRTMAMLGLGDIVIPGMMLAFALRFDLYLYYFRGRPSVLKKVGDTTAEKPKYTPATGSWGERFWTASSLQSASLQAKSFPKPYFYASVAGYLIGMIVTILVMQIAQHAQPALLYLVPGVLICLWGTAFVRGDLKLLWAYTEDQEERDKEKKAKDTTETDDTKTYKANQNNAINETKREDVKASASEKKSDNATKDESTKAAKDESTTLISFSIVLPAKKTPKHSKASTNLDDIATSSSSNIIDSKSSSHASASTEESYEVIPDIKADHEILDKLSREITRNKEEDLAKTRKEEQEPPGKRRRKA